MLETERYRLLFYANEPPKIQQFTLVRRHWEKNTAGILKISCLLLFNFALFSPLLLSQVSAQLKKFISWKPCRSDEEISILLIVCAHYQNKTWSTWLFSKTTASWGIIFFWSKKYKNNKKEKSCTKKIFVGENSRKYSLQSKWICGMKICVWCGVDHRG